MRQKKRAQLHPFSCPKARPHRVKLLCKTLGRQLLPEEVLGTPEGVKVYAEWSLAAKLFGRNRNRRGTRGRLDWGNYARPGGVYLLFCSFIKDMNHTCIIDRKVTAELHR